MVVLGIDAHKRSHTLVAVDEVGRRLATQTVPATDDGHHTLITWARRQFPDQPRIWAVEDCRHVTTRLERALLTAAERVVRVPPKLMATTRDTARTRGKSDPIDALAVARAALREPDLPTAAHDPASREVKLLVDHRDDLVATRTATINRLRWHLHELDPALDIPAAGLHRPTVLDRLTTWLDTQPAGVLTGIAAELLADIAALTTRITRLHREITDRVQQLAPQLMTLAGAGALTAGKILAETANITRFRSQACYAMHAGVAPIPASSGNHTRHRLARGGNRQLNAALHRIAITQIRLAHSPGHAYYHRRRAQGDTSREAIRALKRHLARTVFNLLRRPTPNTASDLPAAA
jgi:transposase